MFPYDKNTQKPSETNRNKRKIAMSMSMSVLFRFVSRQFRNTETNRKIFFFREKDWNRSSFSLFKFKPKQKIVCFEDTLYWTEPYIGLFWHRTKSKSDRYYLQYQTNISSLLVDFSRKYSVAYRSNRGESPDRSCGKSGIFLLFWIWEIRLIRYRCNLYRISQYNIQYKSSVRYRTEKLNIRYRMLVI